MDASDRATRRVVLVESSDALPGLLPFQAWDALALADVVYVRDADAHPSAPSLHAAGLDLTVLEPATLDRSDLDLSRPGSPEDRRLAKALLAHCPPDAPAVFLLGPDDHGLAGAVAGMAADADVEIELVFFAPQPAGTEFVRLVEVMGRLRDPDDGCPWDLEQDHRSLVHHLVEETYELVDAIERDDDEDLVEELGDVLLQVVFHAHLAAERRAFAIDDVARGIVDKLVRRHPHVFADGDAETAGDVQERWDQLKDAEKDRDDVFDGVPLAMPALQLVDRLHRRARRHVALSERTPAVRLRAGLEQLEAATAPAA
ncbi:MAG: MazG family protein, partial [Nitriliruptoraceae bacterium]